MTSREEMTRGPNTGIGRRAALGLIVTGGAALVTGHHVAQPGAADGLSGPYRISQPHSVRYPTQSGPGAAQTFGELVVPHLGPNPNPVPVVVMIHGGGWSEPVGLSYMRPLARDVASHGMAVWNIEYRRVNGGGGWPTTLTDVAAAVDFVPTLSAHTAVTLDTNSVHVIGHSAGGHLTAWVASRPVLPPGAPGSAPTVRVRTAVAMAGVFDLATASDRRHDHFVNALLGGTDRKFPDRYRLASPINHLPTGIPVTCLHGTADRQQPPEQSRNYVAKATSLGDPATFVSLPGVGHTQFADPTSVAWRTSREHLLTQIGYQ